MDAILDQPEAFDLTSRATLLTLRATSGRFPDRPYPRQPTRSGAQGNPRTGPLGGAIAGNFVRSALISGAEELIRQLGGRPPAVARHAGVPFEALRDPDIPLP